MSLIVPAILPTSLEDLQHKLAALRGVVDSVQIDVVDGIYAGPASWPYLGKVPFTEATIETDTLPYLGEMVFEMDLMIMEPEQAAGIWINGGANRITLHVESTPSMPAVIADLQMKYGHERDFATGLLSLGVAIHIDSNLASIDPYVETLDYVQFMGIDSVGKQGQPYDARVLSKIQSFKQRHPTMMIQVDGGVSLETAPPLLAAGVSRLIIGSAFWDAANLSEVVKQFQDLGAEYGITS